jgi:hypothetical protein
MQPKSKPARTHKASQKRDPLATFKEQARPFLHLMFSNATPQIVRDLLSSWLTELEAETQTLFNDREIVTLALPKMLRAAANKGHDINDLSGSLYINALSESTTCNDTGGHIPPTITNIEIQRTVLERDAEALSRIMLSPHTPREIHTALGDALAEFLDLISPEQPDVLRARYPLAVLKAEADKKVKAQQ